MPLEVAAGVKAAAVLLVFWRADYHGASGTRAGSVGVDVIDDDIDAPVVAPRV